MSKLDLSSEHPKISSTHLQRLAYVYIRQSSPKQVQRNQESQANQRHLVERAKGLGWHPDRIHVVDADLGQSAKTSEARTGFNDLLAEISLAHVGIVFGYEVSRIARNNTDWYRLLDLAAIFGTLIADIDGVYDPRLYNDRLLLGMKGTLAEAELHILHLRMDAGRLSKVRKGSYRQVLPTGLTRLVDGSVVKDPDEQVQHTIELVFAKFAELGSCHRVLRYLKTQNIPLPRRQHGGSRSGETLWKQATDAAILAIVSNPAYAGAFVYGRRQGNPARYKPGRPATGRPRMPMEEWIHVQHDVYPAYIAWQQYIDNRTRLRQNHTRFEEMAKRAQGVAREGAALLQGLVVCGMCGHHMHLIYRSQTHYVCDSLKKRVAGKRCQSAHMTAIDDVVIQAFFEAIRPAQLNALEGVLLKQSTERDQLTRHWQERLKRAQYEARLAERQYNGVDPDNRLVANTLEQRWEEKLRELNQTQEDYNRFLAEPILPHLTPQLREQFKHISETLPTLWNSGQISGPQKKELLRSLISQVILKRLVPDRIEVKIVWISGHYTIVEARPNVLRERDMSNYGQMVECVHELCLQGLDDEQIAAQLTTEGFHSARRTHVVVVTVQKIRIRHDWFLIGYTRRSLDKIDGRWTTRGLSRHLGLSANYIHCRIYDGTIPAQYLSRDPASNLWLIEDRADIINAILARYHKHQHSGGHFNG